MKFFVILACGVSAQLIPGLDVLPSFAVSPVIDSVRNNAASVLPESLPLKDTSGNPINTTELLQSMPDSAIIELLSSEKTTDPTQWDADFIETIFEGQDVDTDAILSGVQTAQNAIEILSSDDLSGSTVIDAIDSILENSPALKETLVESLGGEDAWNELQDTIETGLDTLNLTDEFWTDPSQWNAESLGEKLGGLEDLGVPAEYLQLATDALVNVTETDLLPDGLSLDSLTSGFDPCLDVLTVARSYLRIPRLSEIVNFDWVEFFVDIIGLANDGVNCYVTMQELQGQTVPENLFEYLSYFFMIVEKSIRFYNDLPALKSEWENLVLSAMAQKDIVERYKDLSYIEYAERVVDSLRFLLKNQFTDLLEDVATFYNMLIDDVPVLSEYNFSTKDFKTLTSRLDNLLKMIGIELDTIQKLGGKYIEDWVLATYFDETADGSFSDTMRNATDEPPTTKSDETPTTATLPWWQTILQQAQDFYQTASTTAEITVTETVFPFFAETVFPFVTETVSDGGTWIMSKF